MKLFACWLPGVLVFALAGCGQKAAEGPKGPPVVQVVAVEAKTEAISETLSQVGSIVANEMVELKAETDGIVQEILFEEGELVEAGQLLIRLDESKFAAALAKAEADFKLSRANYERARQLYEDRLISQQEYDQAASVFAMNEATLALHHRQLKDARIVAPFKGVVGSRNVSPGQVITKSTTLTWLVDLDPVKVEIHVPERFLSQVQVGQTVEFSVAAYLGQKFKGKVYFVSPYVDPAYRTVLVKAEIPNPDHVLKPGMFASLDLTLQNRPDSVVIPEAALAQVLEGDSANVFVVDGSETVQVKNVSLGVRLAGWVEVTKGLQTGERVIVEGTQKVAPGSKVKLAPPESAQPYMRIDEKARG